MVVCRAEGAGGNIPRALQLAALALLACEDAHWLAVNSRAEERSEHSRLTRILGSASFVQAVIVRCRRHASLASPRWRRHAGMHASLLDCASVWRRTGSGVVLGGPALEMRRTGVLPLAVRELPAAARGGLVMSGGEKRSARGARAGAARAGAPPARLPHRCDRSASALRRSSRAFCNSSRTRGWSCFLAWRTMSRTDTAREPADPAALARYLLAKAAELAAADDGATPKRYIIALTGIPGSGKVESPRLRLDWAPR